MSAPVAVLRQPWARVNIAGVGDIQSPSRNTIQAPGAAVGVIAVQCQYGFDLQVATATVTCTDKPAGATYGQQIQIYMMASGSPNSGQGLRFQGTIVEFDYTHYPKSVDIVCRGWLYAAQKYQVNGATPIDGDPFPENGGIDLSNQGSGQNDGIIVSTIIETAALATAGMIGIPVGDVLGIGAIFGAVCPENCRWAEGQSALDAIGMFDAVCLGYRTYDTPGFVVRKLISATPDPGNVRAVFREGVDILSGTGQYSILDTQGSFVVTGGTKTKNNPTNAAYSFFLAGSNPYTNAPEQTSSPLLEKSLGGDPGPGLSCEEVAIWRKQEMDRALASISFDTPRDDLINPGDTIQIISDWRLGATAGYYWVQNAQTGITEESVFTQTLTCIGAAL